jgi:hypothetical protein
MKSEFHYLFEARVLLCPFSCLNSMECLTSTILLIPKLTVRWQSLSLHRSLYRRDSGLSPAWSLCTGAEVRLHTPGSPQAGKVGFSSSEPEEVSALAWGVLSLCGFLVGELAFKVKSSLSLHTELEMWGSDVLRSLWWNKNCIECKVRLFFSLNFRSTYPIENRISFSLVLLERPHNGLLSVGSLERALLSFSLSWGRTAASEVVGRALLLSSSWSPTEALFKPTM